jgi:hypothetical protein
MLPHSCSVFPNAYSTDPVNVDIEKFLTSERHKESIIRLRAEQDKKKRDQLKAQLPAATISGTFTRRSIDGLKDYNGLVCLDFDAKDNPDKTPEQMKELLASLPEVAWAQVSAGGAGVFAIVCTNNTDPTKHSQLVSILTTALAQLGLVADKACKDVSRLRYISYDDAPYRKEDYKVLNTQPILEKAATNLKPRPLIIRQQPIHNNSKTVHKVNQLITALECSCRDVTDNYDDWLRIGFALASEFGADGLSFYHRLSQFSTKYDHAATEKKYAELLRNGRRVKIGTFFKIMEQNGITI